MKLQLPFHGNYTLTQGFGENKNAIYKEQGLKGHGGHDYAMPIGTPLYASCTGTVIAKSTDIARGEGVAILSDEIFQYKGQDCHLDVIVWHLQDKSIVVNVGDHVTVGQFIGNSGNTGISTGPHCHLQVNPLKDLASRIPLAMSEGYGGGTDPNPYLDFATVNFSHSWSIPVQRVKDFQTKHGLVADGRVGPLTQAVIESLI